MELAVLFQLYQASMALLLGLAAGLFYDILRAIRHRIGRAGATVCLDILYWLIFAIALFIQTMIIGQGFLQLFLLLANFCGAVVYFIALSAQIRRVLEKTIDKLTWISLFLTKPMRIIWSKCRNWTGRHKKDFQNRVKQYIINVTILQKIKKKKNRVGGERSAQKKKRKYIHKTSRTGTPHLHLDYANRSPRSNRKRTRGKGADGAHSRRTSADQ